MNYLTAKQNNTYQLQLIEAQMKAATQNTQLQINLAQTEGDIKMQQTLYSYDNGPSGSWFIDALKASVRPVITYVFFGIWVLIELLTLSHAIHQGKDLAEIVPIIWDQNTWAIFVTLISFWFGDRLLNKYAIFPPINQPITEVVKKPILTR